MLLCLALAAAPAQDAPPQHTGVRTFLGDLGGDITHLPSRENLTIALTGGVLALGTLPYDQAVNTRLRNHYDTVNAIFAPGKYYGGTPVQVALSLGTWLVGRVTDKPRVAHLGMDLLRAQIVTEMLVQPIKYATGRERPDGSDHQSFPSGHAAITFAAAAVIERHLGWKGSLAAYAVAAYVSTSRVHDNVHYLSDVVFGAAVGTIAGRTVTRHGREHWTLYPGFVPGGVAIVAARTP
jgi:membrane-associated phospholipid phosphatase